MVQDPMNNGPQPTNRGWGWNRDPWGAGCGWFVLFWVIIILIFAGWGWWGGGWGGRGWNNAGYQGVPPMNVTNNYYFGGGAEGFLGKRITLTGRVGHIYNDQVFTLAPQTGGGPGLLVVMNKAAAAKPALKKDEEVTVTGMVEDFNRAALEKRSQANLSDQGLAPYEHRPVILGSAVKPDEHPVTNMGPQR